MIQLMAFVKKEWTEVLRTGKFVMIAVLFILFGVMNPAIAKLTPWMMEAFSESLKGSGLTVTEAKVDALTSWMQFYKNVPVALIVFLLMFSGILAVEYQKGTLINMITKGLSRWKIVLSKSVVLLFLWSLGYWMCYGITYVYNAYFWDNSIAKDVGFAAFCVYMLGVWLIALMMLMSTLFSAGSAVAVGTGGVFFVLYLFSMLPDLKEYLPSYLMSASGLLSGAGEAGDYTTALLVAAVLAVIQLVVAILVFNRKDV
ncbi:ABC transporter permease subunit [Faecalicatena contorta]|uniref:ABC transporter permease subunit n=1 Tax=Faecalicatena contorta TaxID=39482 RepID=UPI001F472D97|nr:ABC transporter permease subunit [Faecalicatena contorta]MCF2680066.1 ABC transporter permease subunit [Faecalicatena contorta]